MRPCAYLILAAAALALAGCAAGHYHPTERGATLDRDAQPRSLALSAPMVADAQTDGWWSGRNDGVRGVYVFDDPLVYDNSVRRVYDGIRSHNGDVNDHYHEFSYKTRVRVYAP